MTPAERARRRGEARRLLDLAAQCRREAGLSRNPGHASWLEYVAGEHVARARGVLRSMGETFEHLRPRQTTAPIAGALTPLRRNVTHLDDRTGSGVAACGADIYPRVRLDLAPAASSWPSFYRAARLGSACPECLEEVEVDTTATLEEQSTGESHVLG